MALPLHFSGDTPEDQFYTDFGNLNKFEDEVCPLFTRSSAIKLCWLFNVGILSTGNSCLQLLD